VHYSVCIEYEDNISSWDTTEPGKKLHFWYADKIRKPTVAAEVTTTSDGAAVFSSAHQSSAYRASHVRHRRFWIYYSRWAWSAPTPAAHLSRPGRWHDRNCACTARTRRPANRSSASSGFLVIGFLCLHPGSLSVVPS